MHKTQSWGSPHLKIEIEIQIEIGIGIVIGIESNRGTKLN
jgi:hypothetical protein